MQTYTKITIIYKPLTPSLQAIILSDERGNRFKKAIWNIHTVRLYVEKSTVFKTKIMSLIVASAM
jgi:hypothetical protein